MTQPANQASLPRATRASLLRRTLPAAALLAGAGPLGGAAHAQTAPPARAAAGLDHRLRVHPLLQSAAKRDPDKRVRVLVQKRTRGASSAAIAQGSGASVQEEFSFVKTALMELPLRAVLQIARNPNVLYVSPETAVRLEAVDASRLRTSYGFTANADKVWNHSRYPATGLGVTVAVLDTGVQAKHPDFVSGKGGNIVSRVTTVTVNKDSFSSSDGHGHGTHVAGTIAGRQRDGYYIGVAPGAKILSIKIANEQGMATSADLLRGLQWCYEQRATHNIRVVNLSITAATPESYRTSPVAAAVEQLWFAGVVVVSSAGNRGLGPGATWYAPANDPYVITVGALDDGLTADGADDTLASWSARGLTQDGFSKPEIVAPGRRVVSALSASSSVLGQTFRDRVVDSSYIRLSGTSMAAPVVSGIVALLLERFPKLTPDQVKHLLVNNTRTYAGQTDAAGVVDAFKVFTAVASGRLGVANQGLTPNSGVDPVSGTVLWDQAYWDQAYWDQAYWDQAYWDQSSAMD